MRKLLLCCKNVIKFINISMEDSKNALFIEPNAYINHFKQMDKCEVKPVKKVVFSEPYDCMPNFYFNNHFEKGDCNCVLNKKHNDCNKHDNCNSHNSDCKSNDKFSHQHNCNCDNHNKSSFGFDIKNLMPILSSFNKGGVGGLNLNSITSLFNSSGGFDFSKMLSNPQLITSVMSMFSNKKKSNIKREEIVCTDYEIKNYTRV